MDFHVEAAEFLGHREALFPPFSKVGRAWKFISGTWEDKIGDLEIADRAAELVGAGVEFPADHHRGFTGFVGRARIAQDCREDTSVMDNECVVADFRNKRPGMVSHNKSRQHDEGVCGGDEKAPFLKVVNATFGKVNAGVDFGKAGGPVKLMVNPAQA